MRELSAGAIRLTNQKSDREVRETWPGQIGRWGFRGHGVRKELGGVFRKEYIDEGYDVADGE